MKKFMSVLLSLVLLVILCIGICPTTFAAQSQLDKILAFAKSKIGSTEYVGRCQAFVYQCYKAGGIDNGPTSSAIAAWEKYGVSTSRTNIPIGACVYFDENVGSVYGHVGIYIGDNKLIHSRQSVGKVVEETMTWFFNNNCYLGWGWEGGVQPSTSTSSEPANDIWLLSPPDGVLSLRTGATTSATKICDIPGGKYITVTKYANDGKWDWGYTTYNGQSGWVCLYYASKHTTHSYGSWQTVTAATCTTAGSQKRTCACGAVEMQSISALGHNYSSTYTVDKAATCTVAGSNSRHCTRCTAVTDVTSIPPTGHTYGGWQTVTNATCTTAGSQKRTCACGAVETQSIPASGHSFGAWTTEKAATCTAEGKEYRKCSSCGNYSTRAVSALGHNYSSSFTIDKAATCTVAGSKSKHCTRCSATTEVTAIPATGHSYGSWQTVSAATCTATGSQKRSCTSCGNTEYRTISALGHNYSSSWTVDKAATCTTSGTKSHHCTRCEAKSDITTVPALEHSWSGWTVTKQATVDSTGLKVRKCTNSGCTSQESAVIAKLAADGHTHDFGEWFTETAATCTADGVQKRICSDCKAYETLSVSAKGHSFGEWSVEKNATCTEGGTQKRGCSTCSETETLSSPAIGHSFGEWTVKIEATAETEGSLERKCADCSETETQSTPKLNGSANTSSTVSTDGNSSKPDVSDKDTSSAPQNKSDLTTVIVICSVAIGAILAALVVLVIIKKKK